MMCLGWRVREGEDGREKDEKVKEGR